MQEATIACKAIKMPHKQFLVTKDSQLSKRSHNDVLQRF